MESTPKILSAQALAAWVQPENILTPADARAEAQYHSFLVGLFRPAPTEMQRALACVLAIPPASRGPGK